MSRSSARPEDARADRLERDEPYNLAVLALQAVVVRVGWIFKTESVIMPAFLDQIAGAAWLRGMLPVMNRVGQSLPPFLLARRLADTPYKRSAILLGTLGQSAVFLALAGLLSLLAGRPGWLPAVFLLLYCLYFAFVGLTQLALGTIQGKLIRPARRGRLLAASTSGGAAVAAAAAFWLLPGWIERGDGYARIFAMTGSCFGAAALLSLVLREPADPPGDAAPGPNAPFRAALATLRADANYRRLVLVAAGLSGSLLLFPHYQALARERLDLAGVNLMIWVVVQNLSMGAASLVVGPFADRRGNRLALRLVLCGAALVPVLAIALTRIEGAAGRRSFWLVYLAIGLLPVALRLLQNYTLEISPVSEHPRYLSTLTLCSSTVFLVSPLVGLLIDLTSFELVFAAGALVTGASAALTFRLIEPRHGGAPGGPPAPAGGDEPPPSRPPGRASR